MRYLLILVIGLKPILTTAQFTDSFSDGNITQNPAWIGDTAHFDPATEVLHLTAPAVSDTAILATRSSAIEEASWELDVRLDFNPSSVNYCRIYLITDTFDHSLPMNAYFVRLGGNEDDISLYKQTGNTITKLIDGRDDVLDRDSNNLRLRVTRLSGGYWQLFSDTGQSFFLEGGAVDSSIVLGQYFGIFCKYTATRSKQFYFDNIVVSGKAWADTILPKVKDVLLLSGDTIKLHFSEAIDSTSVTQASNVHIVSPKMQSISVVIGESNKELLLHFGSLDYGQAYEVYISGLADLWPNVMRDTTISIYKAGPGDVLITELYVKPDSNLSDLPPIEYIEIYGNSQHEIDMRFWTMADESGSKLLPELRLKSLDYKVLVQSDDAALFDSTNTIPCAALPSLNNAGDHIYLYDQNGTLIHEVKYTEAWYGNSRLAEGGRSLEMADIDQPCNMPPYWGPSEDVSGGTPGYENSLEVPEGSSISILRLYPSSDSSVHLIFDLSLNIQALADLEFSVFPELPIAEVIRSEKGFNRFEIRFTEAMIPNIKYELSMFGLQVCTGEVLNELQFYFGLPVDAKPNDLVINEVLFNPHVGGSDFVELYNQGESILDLSTLFVGEKRITTEKTLSFPADFHVITPDTGFLSLTYPKYDRRAFIEAKLPTLADDSGIVTIYNQSGLRIDEMEYREDMHFKLIRVHDGVSLERIHYDLPSLEATTWHSASSAVGYASPGIQNSQLAEGVEGAKAFSVQPEMISPNNDGVDDFLTINYELDEAGWVGSIAVFDLSGRQLRELVNNQLLGKKGSFIWDGSSDEAALMHLGWYVILIKTYDLNGNRKSYRFPVAIGTI